MFDPSKINSNLPEQQSQVIVHENSTVTANVESLVLYPGDLCKIMCDLPKDAQITGIDITHIKDKESISVKIEYSRAKTYNPVPANDGPTVRGYRMQPPFGTVGDSVPMGPTLTPSTDPIQCNTGADR